ncbi:MAG TPA: hypothetical protein PK530_20155 [Anaerolineales bacterium]|nr:hypothetical protein [Anaerolineales bacterium]
MLEKPYIPKVGEFIKIRAWHGVVIDVFENERGKTVLRVQTVRNVFRKLGPEFIELDLAPEQIAPASLPDLQKEIEQHRKMQENALAQLLAGELQPI